MLGIRFITKNKDIHILIQIAITVFCGLIMENITEGWVVIFTFYCNVKCLEFKILEFRASTHPLF